MQAIVIDVSTKKPKSMGRHDFAILPRINEWIDIEIDGKSHMFAVVMVTHSAKGHGNDIFVQHVGETSQAIKELCE